MQKDLEIIQTKIKYTFKNSDLLIEALTHPSASYQDGEIQKNYERLEFLGDSVLSLVITELLLERFPNETEGDLAKRRSYLVSGEVLSLIAQNIGMPNHIIMSRNEENCGGKDNKQILENTVESLIGAMYIDGGIQPCENFIVAQWEKELSSTPPIDPKTFLQEWSQAKGYGIPHYSTINTQGSDHRPMFTVSVSVKDMPSFSAEAQSKKAAEKKVAQLMIDYITNSH